MKQTSVFVKDDRLRPPWRVLIFAVAFVLLATILWSVYFIVTGGVEHEPSRLSEEISGEIAALAAVVILSFWMRRFVDRRSAASLGLWMRRPALRLLLIGIGFGAFMQGVVLCIEALTKSTRIVGVAALHTDERSLGFALLFFCAVAVFEELTFRGYLFQNFWEGFGLIPAVAVTSILFAGFHLYNPNAQANVIATIAGLLLYAIWACYSVIWTRSLWFAIGAHLAWNFFEGPVLGFPVSGLLMPFQTVFTQATGGPAWLTGGAFGPEAGVSSLVALALGLLGLAMLSKRGVFANAPDVREVYARVSPMG